MMDGTKEEQRQTHHNNNNTMLRDDEMFPIATRIIPTEEGEEEEILGNEDDYPRASHPNDDFDDIFGSEPPSPTSPSSPFDAARDDDASRRGRPERSGNLEPSDIPRLREKHETEGYRDGVTKGKAQSIQAGFDEGYTLGAVLGLRVGKILGLLEGIVAGVVGAEAEIEAEAEWKEQKERLERLWVLAREDLGTASVFGKEYWGGDGIWIFEVPGEKDEGGEVVFEDVVSAHPLVRKWAEIVEEECARWGVDLDVFAGEGEGEREGEDAEEVDDAAKGVVKDRKQKREPGRPAKESTAEAAPASSAAGNIMGVSKEQLSW